MISEQSRHIHISKLADAMGYVIDSIDSTSVPQELKVMTDAPCSLDDLKLSLVRMLNECGNLQLKDQLM